MKKIYFLSDLHLGARTLENPLENERRVVRWFDSVKEDASAIYLMGDILDYWYEYKTVVPRGFTRFFGKVAELTDKGIDVHWFIGNHDIWIFDYLPDELGVKVHYTPEIVDLNGKTFYLAHGDGLGDTSLTFVLYGLFFIIDFVRSYIRQFIPVGRLHLHISGLLIADRPVIVKIIAEKRMNIWFDMRKPILKNHPFISIFLFSPIDISC